MGSAPGVSLRAWVVGGASCPHSPVPRLWWPWVTLRVRVPGRVTRGGARASWAIGVLLRLCHSFSCPVGWLGKDKDSYWTDSLCPRDQGRKQTPLPPWPDPAARQGTGAVSWCASCSPAWLYAITTCSNPAREVSFSPFYRHTPEAQT